MKLYSPILATLSAVILFGLSHHKAHAQDQITPAVSETSQTNSTSKSSADDPEANSETLSHYHHEIVAVGHDVTLKKHETSRDIVVIGGNAIIEGTVRGSLVVVFGSAKVTGKVEQDLVVVLGSTDLGPKGEIGQDASVVGGKLNLAPDSKIGGERIEVMLGDKLPNLNWVGDWVMKGALLARPLPPQFTWVWIVAGIFLLIYLLIAAVFPQPVQACVSALEMKPAGSFFAGLLALALFGPVLFLLVISVAGILVVPILLFALLAAVFFGKVAIYQATGSRIGRQFNLTTLQSPAVALLIGLLIFYLLYTVPILGFLVWGIATAWGLGAVVVATFSSFHKEQASTPVVTSASALASTTPPSMDIPPPLTGLPGSPELLSLRRAGFWIRFWATMLDLILLGTLMAFVGVFFLPFWAAYHIAMWTWKGTTIGGIVLGIKVLRIDGTPVNFSVALVRSLSSFFSALVLFIGFFWAGWDRDKQAWHDKIAGTIVVKVPKGVALI
jgi:uncharacterized RDD family membrane protein YckC